MDGNVVWVDIPVINLKRAIQFYAKVLDQKVALDKGPGFEMGILHHTPTKIGGCLYVDKKVKPGKNGPLVYFSVEGRLDAACKAVVKNKGKILIQKHPIGEHGFRAVILDTEGNRVALHSMK